MTEFEPCPICGSKPESYKRKNKGDFIVFCWKDDHVVQVSGETLEDTTDSWNTRYGETYHMEQSGAGEDVACANCGAYNIAPFRDGEGHLVIPAYCPSCGCKVVD